MDIIATKRQIPVMRKKKEGVGGAREVGTYSGGGRRKGRGRGETGGQSKRRRRGRRERREKRRSRRIDAWKCLRISKMPNINRGFLFIELFLSSITLSCCSPLHH